MTREHQLSGLQVERLFSMFDEDHSGHIDAAEFVIALQMFTEDMPTLKLRFIFNVLDLDGESLRASLGLTDGQGMGESQKMSSSRCCGRRRSVRQGVRSLGVLIFCR